MRARRTYVAFGAAIFILAWFFGGIDTYFTDNLYNRALVARSAQSSGPALETGYKHWFFDGRPAVRPEDWHRGASLLAYAAVARQWPGLGGEFVRTAHAVMFTVWGLTIMALVHLLASRQTPVRPLPENTIPGLAGLVFLGAVTSMPFLSRVAMNTYLDDLPAALAVLTACALMLIPGGGPVRIAAAGALAGAAFWMKDLYLVWILCAPAVAWILIPETGERFLSSRRRAAAAGLFTAAMLTVVASKLAWNMAELGASLPGQARMALNARLIANLPDAENQFFHHMAALQPPTSYAAALFANDPAALLMRHALATLEALKDNGLIVLFLAITVSAVLAGGLNTTARRVLTATLVFTAAFGVFFSAGLGEAGQLRYWLAPFGGALALATALVWQGLCAARNGLGPLAYRRLKAWLWAALAVIAVPQGLLTLARTYGAEPPFTDKFMEQTVRWARPGETILVQLHRGTYLWSRYPYLAFTGISAEATEAADCAVLHAVTREARARVAAVAYRPVTEKLKTCGFRIIQQTDTEALLATPAAAARLSPSWQ